jgi:D-alanyl-D-alanine endopeptidase (penicillin-binding protein 7)
MRRLRSRPLAALLSITMAAFCIPAGATGTPAAPAAAPQSKPATAKPTAKKSRSSRSRSRHHAAATPPSNGALLGLHKTADELKLQSSAALVVDQDTGEMLAMKNPDVVLPIASLTKLMTALVVIDSHPDMDETLEISSEDVDTTRNTHSRLTVGTQLTRDEMLLLALMSSENRAAMSLSRNYPGGRTAFVAQMNAKAQALGMTSTHFGDPAGLSNESVSTARDLRHLIGAAYAQPLIRSYTTQPEKIVRAGRHTLTFINSNRLVRSTSGDWDIELQKTGFTNEAGRCLVMQVKLLSRRLAMIFLDSTGTLTRYADAARVRKRIEHELKALKPVPIATTAAAASS